MLYQTKQINELRDELVSRMEHLRRLLATDNRSNDNVMMDGLEIRLAVDDFKAILTKIRRIR